MASQVLPARNVVDPTALNMHAGVPKLPQIEHPLMRMSSPGKISIRGTTSRASNSRPEIVSCRPLGREENDWGGMPSSRHSFRASVSGGGMKNGHHHNQPPNSAPYKMMNIPESVEVVHGDPNKTQLPIFGSRADAPVSREASGRSRPNTQLSEITSDRLEIDELEMTLREKMKNGYYEMRKRFIDNDPEQNGNVTRDALLRILVSVLNRPVTLTQLSKLLIRLGMRPDKLVVSFNEFHTAFRAAPDASEYPRWMDPVQRHHQEKVMMSADEVHANLQAKMKQRFVDLADVFPQFIDGGAGRIMKPELKNTLNKMHFFMEEDDFEKLWKRYDPNNSGVVNGVQMLKEMGIIMKASPQKKASTNKDDTGDAVKAEAEKSKVQKLGKHEQDRERSLMVEKWLKDKFREGFNSMRSTFEGKDPDSTGIVDFDVFLNVLNDLGLSLERRHLAEFLSRCAVSASKKGVPYREFLHRFQDRSDAGMTHKILSNPYHKPSHDDKNKVKALLSDLESQLMNMFQRDFLQLLATFQKLDRYDQGMISKEEFRAAIESRFRMDFTDDQFVSFMDNVPLDDSGLVKYGDFMKQFDTKGMAPSLFNDKKKETKKAEPVEEEDVGMDRLVINQESEVPRKTVEQTRAIIKQAFDTRFQDIERAFHDIDEYNSGYMTPEQMYLLLKSLNLDTEISRGEIRDLWKSFIVKDNNKLEYKEFVRHFIYNKETCAFPNAKVVPPRKGDSDLMMTSKKLNGVSDMLQDNLRFKIDYMWEPLRHEFTEMDPYGTGFVSREEFQEILRELCVHLCDYEVDLVTKKFVVSDGRVSYVEFLKPFAMKRQLWRHGNNMLSLLQHTATDHSPDDAILDRNLTDVLPRIRQKMAMTDTKSLRRAFRKVDSQNTGTLSMVELRSVLKLTDVVLTDEEEFQLLQKYDTNLTGRISYMTFLQDTAPPPHPPRSVAGKQPRIGASRSSSRKETAKSINF